MPENGTTSEEALAESVLGYIKELSELKFSSEEKREQNLIQQSSHMQTVFSFVSVTVLMVFPILMEKIKVIPPSFFFWSATTILLPLFASLLISSITQWRWKTKSFLDIVDLYKFIEDNYEDISDKSSQLKQWIDYVGCVQKEMSHINNRRVKLIIASMICFWASVSLIFVWFFIALARFI